MIEKNGWLDLAWQSVIDPRAAAPVVVRVSMDPAALPLALALVSVLNGILYSLVLPAGFLPPMLSGPVALALMMAVVMVAGGGLITGLGHLFGGTGGFPVILRVLLWVQLIRLAAQVVVSAVEMISPMLALFGGTAAGVWGIYMTVCLVTEAHGFDARVKALAVLALAFVAGVLVLSILLSMAGVTPVETGV